MAEEKNMTVATEEKTEATAPKTENQYLLKLNRPYVFEGKEYAEIDLAGLDKLTVQDAINAQRQLFNEREPAAMLLCETTTAFVRILAAKATGLPIEFFKLAPRSVSRRIYGFEGKQYTEIDLNGVADLNSLNESAAENRLTRAGFMVTDTSYNYLYACILAGMATGLPEEFFTGLPLYEVLKIKNAVNDAGFFE